MFKVRQAHVECQRDSDQSQTCKPMKSSRSHGTLRTHTGEATGLHCWTPKRRKYAASLTASSLHRMLRRSPMTF
ncbi:hypothetical protein DPMN_105324 [Dreissena polymorpha]|uniref:Uncharacterized protein n=1 Tax=Dreissena polymorpha TaxID=45954 RepID=A0A9D4HDL6_DREPO|nr:hypothetical protein DPMN_105324 [Dreissena polymorpha]